MSRTHAGTRASVKGARSTIKVTTIDDEGCEHEHELPARREVCPRCEGYGTHLNPSIGEHAYTREEFEESFHDPEDRAEYFKRGGIYDVTCERCKGERVIDVLDRAACTTDEQRAALKVYDRQQREDRDYQALCASEQRFGC